MSAAPTSQSTSAPGASLIPESTDAFTTMHLVLIAVLAVLVIVGIVAGVRRARARKEAATELRQHNAEVEEQAAEALPPPAEPVPAPRASDRETELLLPQDDAPAASEPLRDEPIAAATPALSENPAAAAAPPAPAGPAPTEGPVTQLKGLGPKVAERLAALGVTTVGQLAAMTDDEAQALDARLGPFTGRMNRDRWLEQARFLAAGDRAGFEAVFGKL
jgi:predicted flap endonuclease-1-like 5' DNA nuclease